MLPIQHNSRCTSSRLTQTNRIWGEFLLYFKEMLQDSSYIRCFLELVPLTRFQNSVLVTPTWSDVRLEGHFNLSMCSPQRFQFDLHLDGLRSDFEVMANEIESLRKERDEYHKRRMCSYLILSWKHFPRLFTSVQVQAKELQRIRSAVCDRCRRSIIAASGITGSSSPSLGHSIASSSSQGVPPPQQPTFSIATVDPHSQTLTHTSSASQSPTSDVDPVSRINERDRSITSDNDIGKELDLEIEYVFSHVERIWCVKFSRDGKYLAAGCRDGTAYIYDVQMGTLA
jgi:hypothetical protein